MLWHTFCWSYVVSVATPSVTDRLRLSHFMETIILVFVWGLILWFASVFHERLSKAAGDDFSEGGSLEGKEKAKKFLTEYLFETN